MSTAENAPCDGCARIFLFEPRFSGMISRLCADCSKAKFEFEAAPFALLPNDVRVEGVAAPDFTMANCWSAAVDHGKRMEAERDAALARAEAAENELADERICTRGWQDRALAAEKWRDELGWGNQLLGKELAEETKLRQYWRETAFMEEKRAKAAETRLAERDASARRWVRLGCVLALLLPLTAHAADAPPASVPQVVSATIPQPVEPPLQPVTLSPDDYRQLINSRVNELIRHDEAAQLLIAHQNAAQAKAKPGG